MSANIILATVNFKPLLYAATADEFAAITPNIHLGLLAAYLRSKGISVMVIDSDVRQLGPADLVTTVLAEKPLLFGLICTGNNPSSSTMTYAGVVEFFATYWPKDSGIRTFIWGPHVTVLPERSLRETGADFVVRGEGFETLQQLVPALQGARDYRAIAGLAFFDGGRYVQNPNSPLFPDLNDLPRIDWDELDPIKSRAHNWHCFGNLQERSPYAIIWTSFGCPFNCSFCCVHNLFNEQHVQRFRSIASTVAEITTLVEKYKVKHLRILDELFVINKKRIHEFCDRLEALGYDLNMWCYARTDTIDADLLRRLKHVGMNWVSYGFETANPEVFDRIHKRSKASNDEIVKMTRDAGINICADVMVGLPGETMADMERTYEFCVRHNFEWLNIYPFFAYPGTEYFSTLPSPTSWKTYSLYGYDCTPVGTGILSPAEVLRFRDEAFLRYHGRPEYLAMIEGRFGIETRQHIERMIQIKLRRRILESDQQPAAH